MESATKSCGNCGAEVFSDASGRLCTACLFETALHLITNVSSEADDPTRLRDSPTPAPLAKQLADFGDYELLEEIARGGQGVVYRARQKSLNRIVALKVIHLGHWATATHLKRVRLEAEAAASLEHPGIVPVYEIGEHDGSCYFSMRFVEGGQLGAVVKREPIPIRRAAELIAKLARTVSYAHERGILHRDIKPGNILLNVQGEPHLTDFGMARLVETENDITRTSEFLGTPSYMAPEQAQGDRGAVTRATDVYGLGAVLYHLLTGHPPFAGGTAFETVRLVLETSPRKPRLWNSTLAHDLQTVCLKCLEKDPRRRYPSALALAEDLERWLKHEPIRAKRSGFFTRSCKWVRRNPAITVMAALLLIVTVTMMTVIRKSDLIRRVPTTGIAVLPFENLSSDKEDTSLADGVQDDLLTKLAHIADLKVISRTSVMQYRGKQNTREIGKALRVSHVLEGSVHKMGNRLHLNAQLIETRTDSHVWAKQYDGNSKDLFAIQSEIAQEVAAQLHAKISAAEKHAIEQVPTADLAAFDLYSRAKNLLLTATFRGTMRANLLQAADLLNQAVARDPTFLPAYCQLAWAHDQLYWFGFDHTAARLALAEAAIQEASRLRPDAGETHLARAQNLYRGYLDYDGALNELELARHTLPNDPRIFQLTGYIQRRRGGWEESTSNLERAVDLDPRNLYTLQQIGVTYGCLRRYAKQKFAYDRALVIEPNDVETKVLRAFVELDSQANTRPLHQIIDSIQTTNPAAMPMIVDNWLVCALAERDGAAAQDALQARGEGPVALSDDNVPFNRPFVQGVIARMMNEGEQAQTAFTAARAQQEKIVQAQPNYGPAVSVLGLIDAGLGRREQALREGRRAVGLLPVQKDAVNSSIMIKYFAMIAGWVGDKDLACEQLALATGSPGPLSYGQLKLLPFWDPLRGDPRFEKIVTSLAPKDD